jgi:GAF domain-containing protein
VQAAAAARAQLRTAFNDTLAPVVQQIGKVAIATTCERREAYQAQTITKVLSSAVSFVDADRARACWFELTPGSSRRLAPVDHVGRSTAPSTVFVEGTRSGDSVFAALDRGEGRYVPDVDEDPPAGWNTAVSRAYKTFIAVPVEVGGQLFGMLTLDSLRPDDLTGDEVPGLRLLADLLADALAIGAGSGATIPSQAGVRELSIATQLPADVITH